MKREDLKVQGLTDEQIDFVMASNGKDIEKHKADLTTAQAEAATLKTQLTEAGSTIEGFKKLDVDAIKAAADEWKVKAEKAQADAQTQVASLKFDYALDGALSAAKAKNAKAVKALLDASILKMDETGKIAGLEEQLGKIKSENDYLFTPDTPMPQIVKGGNSQSILGDPVIDAARKAAGVVAPAKG